MADDVGAVCLVMLTLALNDDDEAWTWVQRARRLGLAGNHPTTSQTRRKLAHIQRGCVGWWGDGVGRQSAAASGGVQPRKELGGARPCHDWDAQDPGFEDAIVRLHCRLSKQDRGGCCILRSPTRLRAPLHQQGGRGFSTRCPSSAPSPSYAPISSFHSLPPTGLLRPA